MSGDLKLRNPPIVEAVVDIDCDLPPPTELRQLEKRAKELLQDKYPISQWRHTEGEYHSERGRPRQILVLQFLTADEKQIVQIRSTGYSFNRLKPYSSLDDYLPEIERTWALFRRIAHPVQIRKIGLRYINRLLLPTTDGAVELNDYLRTAPHLPDEDTLRFLGFLNQHLAVDLTTGNLVNMTLLMEEREGDRQPIILDIETSDVHPRSPDEWPKIREAILVLRGLKNRVFKRTLTETCLNLFQPL